MHQALERMTGNEARGKEAALTADVLTTKKKKSSKRHAAGITQGKPLTMRCDRKTHTQSRIQRGLDG